LLANLEERSTHGELGCFLEAGNDMLKGIDLVNEATGNVFTLFWEVMILSAEKALSYFWK